MIIRPGDTVRASFIVTDANGAATDASSLPTGALRENGVADGAVTVTVTDQAGAGEYIASCDIPGDYTEGTDVEIMISATVSGVAGKAIVWRERVVATGLGLPAVSSGVASANIVQISGDSAAADNLEAYTDGTTPMPVNATQISGDATAADNLESAADGTGFNLGGGAVVAASVTGAVGSVTAGVTLADGAITAAKIAADAITAAKIATGAIDADALAADAVVEIAAGILTVALTEAYATLGAAPTLAQLLFEVRALLAEKSISSTTMTTKRLDGSTTAATYTTNSATAPTSITRAS